RRAASKRHQVVTLSWPGPKKYALATSLWADGASVVRPVALGSALIWVGIVREARIRARFRAGMGDTRRTWSAAWGAPFTPGNTTMTRPGRRACRSNCMKLGAFSLSLAVADLAASQAFYMALGFEVVGGAPEQN